ncbi:M15 family metallopeptidase [Demequina flava]|uniref:M15 family metallopeptidase n=1 Tax=Demequina flava TaxID=1095025 RepID=UPI00078459F3|nr:M15 family metallopeptidase [Demequina flava]
MNFSFDRFRPHFVLTVVLAAFGTGMVGAQSAFAIDKHIAVSQARAAAAELTERHEELEESLARADAVAAEAAEVADDEPVADAAQDVDAATAKAADAAASTPVATDDAQPVADKRVLAVEAVTPTDEPTATSATPEPTPTAEPAETPGTDITTTPEPAGEAAPVSPSLTPVSEAPAAATTDPDEVKARVDVAKVLEGEVEDPEEARAAKVQIDAAIADIEAAAQEVNESVDQLEETSKTAAHERNLAQAEDLPSQMEDLNAQIEDVLPELRESVEDPELVDAALDAHAALEEAVEDDFAAEDADAVANYIGATTEARDTFDASVEAVKSSHQAWVDAENERIDEENEEALSGYEATYDDAIVEWQAANRTAVALHQNGWSGQPTGVSGSNGNISSASLCEIDFAPGHVLQCDAAASLERADADYYAQTGRHLEMTDSYRTYSSQVATRASKGYMAAIPGTSNHGWGMAVDFDYDAAQWMAANGADYGWVHPAWARSGGSKPEWWHLEYVATSVGTFSAPAKPDVEESAVNLFETDDEAGDDD